MLDSEQIESPGKLGTGSRVFATLMGIVWVVAGIYGIYRGLTDDPLYLIALGALAVIYGGLWLSAARRGKWGKIPLWP